MPLNNGASGLILNRLLHKAFSVAKRIRTETRIASSAESVAFAAVELARKIFDDLAGKTVLLGGGPGDGRLAARHFVTAGAGEVMWPTAPLNGRNVSQRSFRPGRSVSMTFRITSTSRHHPLHHRRPHATHRPAAVSEALAAANSGPCSLTTSRLPRDIDPR